LDKKPKVSLTQSQALIRLQKYCAYQDRCHSEVRSKIMEVGVFGEDLENIIVLLIAEICGNVGASWLNTRSVKGLRPDWYGKRLSGCGQLLDGRMSDDDMRRTTEESLTSYLLLCGRDSF